LPEYKVSRGLSNLLDYDILYKSALRGGSLRQVLGGTYCPYPEENEYFLKRLKIILKDLTEAVLK
jgi:hypothetical protein